MITRAVHDGQSLISLALECLCANVRGSRHLRECFAFACGHGREQAMRTQHTIHFVRCACDSHVHKELPRARDYDYVFKLASTWL